MALVREVNEFRMTSRDVEQMQNEENVKPNTLSTSEEETPWFLYFTVFLTTTSIFGNGLLHGWPIPVVPRLLTHETDVNASENDVSWILTLLGVPGPVLGIPMMFLVNLCGRKLMLVASTLPALASWLMMVFATTAEELMAARTIAGISYSSIITFAPLYVSEVAQDRLRGAMGFATQSMYWLGTLFEICVGPYVSFDILAAISGIFPLLFIVTFVWMPETPYYYLLKDRPDDATKSLIKLRPKNSDIKTELKIMQAFVSEGRNHSKKASPFDMLKGKANQRATALCVILGLSPAICGSLALEAYSTLIFRKEGIDYDTADHSAIIMGVGELVAALAAILLVDSVGRRPLLIASCGGCAVFACMEGFLFMNPVDGFSWLPIIPHVAFQMFFVAGLMPLPYVIVGEIFQADLKGPANVCLTITSLTGKGVLAKVFPDLMAALGITVLMFVFAFFSFLLLVFGYLYLPETKSKSFKQIQDELRGTKTIT